MKRSLIALLATVASAGPAWAQQLPPKPPITQYPAHAGNYSNRAPGRKIDMIVIHDMEGTQSEKWFANPAASASAHYNVHFDGKIFQSVKDEDEAWHAGNGSINARSIGIEHAGYAAKNLFTPKEYDASARLAGYLCAKYKIPIDRKHIIAHAEVPHPSIPGRFGGISGHTDPGKHWDWKLYMSLVKKYADPSPDFDADFVAQSDRKLTLRSGDTAKVWFDLENTGDKAWSPADTLLATTMPDDRKSDFFTKGDWPKPTRATGVDKATPGKDRGRFEFTVTAPSVKKRTTFHEVFRLVEAGSGRFGPNVAIDIVVEPGAGTPPPGPGPGPAPIPAGKGRLEVNVDPLDATIWLSASEDSPGSREAMATPPRATTFDLPAGRLVVTAVRAPYGARSAAVTITAGKTTRVTLDLRRPLLGSLAEPVDVAGVKVTGGAVPTVCDWDQDGELDLLVGQGDGSVTLFPGKKGQKGLDVGAGKPLAAAGKAIDVTKDASPVVADWDGDGDRDLLVGAGDGSVTLFRGDGKGGLDAGKPLALPAVTGAAAPFACDLDQDGTLDLLVGQGDGTVRFHKRAANGSLDAGALLEVAGQPLRVAGPARPVVRDLWQRGLLDLVVGANGEARIFRALPNAAFEDGGELTTWTRGAPAKVSARGALAPALVDFGGDGRVDVVLGDGSGVKVLVTEPLEADLDDSKKVDARDLIRLARAKGSLRGQASYDPAADLDEDGEVEAKDVAELLRRLGDVPR